MKRALISLLPLLPRTSDPSPSHPPRSTSYSVMCSYLVHCKSRMELSLGLNGSSSLLRYQTLTQVHIMTASGRCTASSVPGLADLLDRHPGNFRGSPQARRANDAAPSLPSHGCPLPLLSTPLREIFRLSCHAAFPRKSIAHRLCTTAPSLSLASTVRPLAPPSRTSPLLDPSPACDRRGSSFPLCQPRRSRRRARSDTPEQLLRTPIRSLGQGPSLRTASASMAQPPSNTLSVQPPEPIRKIEKKPVKFSNLLRESRHPAGGGMGPVHRRSRGR